MEHQSFFEGPRRHLALPANPSSPVLGQEAVSSDQVLRITHWPVQSKASHRGQSKAPVQMNPHRVSGVFEWLYTTDHLAFACLSVNLISGAVARDLSLDSVKDHQRISGALRSQYGTTKPSP